MAALLEEERGEAELLRVGVPDRFVEHGKPEELYRDLGMDAESITRRIREALQKRESDKA